MPWRRSDVRAALGGLSLAAGVWWLCHILLLGPSGAPHVRGRQSPALSSESRALDAAFAAALRRPANLTVARSSVAWCAPGLFGDVELSNLDEWRVYHQVLGVERVFIYVSNHTPDYVRRYLRLHDGFLAAVNFSGDGFYHGQLRAISDCLRRTQAHGYQWALFADLDEFLWWDGPARDVAQWLAAVRPFVACLTLGKHFYSRAVRHATQCGVLSYPYTTPTAFCFEAPGPDRQHLCDDYYGRRKTLVRPAKVQEAQLSIHQCDHWGKVDLSTHKARLNEVRGYLQKGRPPDRCADAPEIPTLEDPSIPWYREAHHTDVLVRDDRFAAFLRARLPPPLAEAYNRCRCAA